MTKQVLFIHGAGAGAYEEDKLLVRSLQTELGSGFDVVYPQMPDEVNAPYDLWKERVQEELAAMRGPVILAGHSIGASELAKILTEIQTNAPVVGIFLLAAPFWGGDGWLYEGYEELELPVNTAAKLPKEGRVFLYHARDDETVPFNHLALYAKLLPHATVREIDKGGHQLNDGLLQVATDMKNL